jgi:acetyl-CoA carboxylase carboxyltransferase component
MPAFSTLAVAVRDGKEVIVAGPQVVVALDAERAKMLLVRQIGTDVNMDMVKTAVIPWTLV